MDEQTRGMMPRAGLPSSDRMESVVFWISFGMSTVFAVAQTVFAVFYVPVMLYAYRTAGLTLTPVLAMADALGPLGIICVLSAIDIALYVAFAWAARRYWVGLLYLPPLVYLLIAFIVLASGFGGFPTLAS